MELQTEIQAATRARPHVPLEEARGTVHERFMKLDPPMFAGTMNPSEAEDWLKRMESIFEVMQLHDDQRVTLASFMLKEEARFWWEAARRLLVAPVVGVEGQVVGNVAPAPLNITWDQFVKVFNDKYFPESYRYEQEIAFMTLTQGRMSVAEYEKQFTTLSRFAKAFVQTDEALCKKFQ